MRTLIACLILLVPLYGCNIPLNERIQKVEDERKQEEEKDEKKVTGTEYVVYLLDSKRCIEQFQVYKQEEELDQPAFRVSTYICYEEG